MATAAMSVFEYRYETTAKTIDSFACCRFGCLSYYRGWLVVARQIIPTVILYLYIERFAKNDNFLAFTTFYGVYMFVHGINY